MTLSVRAGAFLTSSLQLVNLLAVYQLNNLLRKPELLLVGPLKTSENVSGPHSVASKLLKAHTKPILADTQRNPLGYLVAWDYIRLNNIENDKKCAG